MNILLMILFTPLALLLVTVIVCAVIFAAFFFVVGPWAYFLDVFGISGPRRWFERKF